MFPLVKINSSELSFPSTTGRSEECNFHSKNPLNNLSKNRYFPYLQDLGRLIQKPKTDANSSNIPNKRPHSFRQISQIKYIKEIYSESEVFTQNIEGNKEKENYINEDLNEEKESEIILENKEKYRKNIEDYNKNKNSKKRLKKTLNKRTSNLKNENINDFNEKFPKIQRMLDDIMKDNDDDDKNMLKNRNHVNDAEENTDKYDKTKENMIIHDNVDAFDINYEKYYDERFLGAKCKFFSFKQKNERFKEKISNKNNMNLMDFKKEIAKFKCVQASIEKNISKIKENYNKKQIMIKNLGIPLPNLNRNFKEKPKNTEIKSYRQETRRKNTINYSNNSKDDTKLGIFFSKICIFFTL